MKKASAKRPLDGSLSALIAEYSYSLVSVILLTGKSRYNTFLFKTNVVIIEIVNFAIVIKIVNFNIFNKIKNYIKRFLFKNIFCPCLVISL